VQRAEQLDAVRGIAAVIVAVFHFLRAFMPESLRGGWNPLSFLWNGHFAVYVFFALSGYLFFEKLHGASPRTAALAMVRRYFRLTLPALAVCLIAWMLHCAGWFHNAAAAAQTGSDWLGRWYQFGPSLGLAIGEPLVGMYVAFDPLRSYNPNLWTIRYELWVVWLVIVLAMLRHRWWALVLAGALSWGTYALPFLAGAGITRWRGWWLLVPGLLLGTLEGPPPWTWPFAAALVVGGTATWKPGAALKWLGSLSFGIYLVHFITINSIASAAYVATGSLAWTLAVYAASTLAAAILFRELVDRPSQKLLAKIG